MPQPGMHKGVKTIIVFEPTKFAEKDLNQSIRQFMIKRYGHIKVAALLALEKRGMWADYVNKNMSAIIDYHIQTSRIIPKTHQFLDTFKGLYKNGHVVAYVDSNGPTLTKRLGVIFTEIVASGGILEDFVLSQNYESKGDYLFEVKASNLRCNVMSVETDMTGFHQAKSEGVIPVLILQDPNDHQQSLGFATVADFAKYVQAINQR